MMIQLKVPVPFRNGFRRERAALLAALLAAVLVGSPPAAEGRAPLQAPGTSAVSELLGKGRALELRGRTALAYQTWQQVLLLDATNAEALEGLIRASRQEGKPAEATQYLDQLRTAHPEDPNLAALSREQAPANQTASAQQAARLAVAGHLPEAMDLYRRLYGNNPPPGETALAYYRTEGALDASRPEAIAGLRALVDRFPRDVRYQRALGSLLVANARTRSEGRKLLDRAPADILLAGAAPAERSGAAALPAQASAAASNGERPRNPRTERELPQPRPVVPATVADTSTPARATPMPLSLSQMPSRTGVDASAKILSSEASPVRTELAQPQPPARSERTDSSPERSGTLPERPKVAILTSSAKTAPDGGPPAAGTHVAETTGTDVQEAARPVAGSGSDVPSAVPRVVVTAASARALETEQRAALAALHGHRYAEAEARFKVVLARDPDNRLALEGLGQVRQRAEASATSPQPVRDAKSSVSSLPSVHGLRLEERPAVTQVSASMNLQPVRNLAPQAPAAPAQVATLETPPAPPSAASSPTPVSPAVSLPSEAKPAEARQVLEAALRASGSGSSQALAAKANVPAQLQLGRLDLKEGRGAEAYALARAVLATDFNRAEAWALLAAALHASGHDEDALAQMDAAPAVVRPQLESDPLSLETLGWIEAGQGQDGKALASWTRLEERLATQGEPLGADVALERARLVARSGDEAQRSASLLALGSRGDLSDDQRRTVQGLWAEWSMEEAAAQARAGEGDRALRTLHAAATAFAGSPAVLRTLAAGYAALHQPREAVTLLRAQDLSTASAPEDAMAIEAALEIRDSKLADSWLRAALLRYPRDAGILPLAARFEETQGHRKEAAAYQQAASAAAAMARDQAASGQAAAVAKKVDFVKKQSANGSVSVGGAGDLIALLQPPRALPSTTGSPGVGTGRPFLPTQEAAASARETQGASR